MRTLCRFYGTPRGCNNGDACRFLHEGPPGGCGGTRHESSRPPRGRGRGAGSSGRGFGYGSGSTDGSRSSLLTRLLQDLSTSPSLELPSRTVQRWVELARQRCAGGQASAVLRSLTSTDGCNMLRAAGLQLTLPQAHLVSSQLVNVLVPLLSLLVDDSIRLDPLLSNPVFSALHGALSLEALAKALVALTEAPTAADPAHIRRQVDRSGGMVMSCTPSDWVEVLCPIRSYLQEVVQRFNLQQNAADIEAARSIVTALATAVERHLPADSQVVRQKTTEWRRLVSSIAILERQLNAQQHTSRVLEQMQDAYAQLEKLQKQKSMASAAAAGPGELYHKGPRHDNDKVNHLEVAVAPTRDEVLSREAPYLPHNRPGSLPHVTHDPDRAHRELHFRLLRHDVVGPVSDAAKAFWMFGGVANLNKLKSSLQHQTPGSSERLQLKTGRDFQDVYVFRNVSILGLTSNWTGGIAYKIEFDDAPQLGNAPLSRRRDWWRNTKQLQHGSLAALWWDGDEEPGSLGDDKEPPVPNIMFVTICERDDKMLAPVEPHKRPQVGVRMCGDTVTSDLMAAVLGRQRLGGKKEVVLLPAAGNFFAYEPILKALQATHPLPLAQYILQRSSAGSSAGEAVHGPVLLRGELVGSFIGASAGGVQVPAYAAGADCCYDFSAVISQNKLPGLSTSDLNRLHKVPTNTEEHVQAGLLQLATTLDASQATALTACLHRELAVVQGPPGCGKTYIGVQLVRLLLANTCSSTTAGPQNQRSLPSGIPAAAKPVIGPILVLCYTNHALDSFLLDLIHAGITEGVIRVGRRSNCPELEPYNLRNQEGGAARGADVARCKGEIERLRDAINKRLERLKASRDAKRLHWSDLQEWLWDRHQNLLEAFDQRTEEMGYAAFLREAIVESDGFKEVKSRRRRQHRHQVAEWVFGNDALQDWLHSSPVQDWQRQQWMQQIMDSWQDEASQRLAAGQDSSPGVHSSPASLDTWESAAAGSSYAANEAQGPTTVPVLEQVYSTAPPASLFDSSSTVGANPFAALAGLEEAEVTDLTINQGGAALTDSSTYSCMPSILPGQMPSEGWMLPLAAGPTVATSAGAGSPDTYAQPVAEHAWFLSGQMEQQQAVQLQQNVDVVLTGSRQGTLHTAGENSTTCIGHQQAVPACAEQVPEAVLMAENAPPRPIEELLQLDDLTLMSRCEREQLYKHWLNTLASDWGNDISNLVSQLEVEQVRLTKLYDQASLQILREACIVGMTTTGLAKQQGLLHALQPKVVIVEEAAEVLEAHIITSLTPSVEHLVLIGDHFQLPPKVEVYELQKESGRGYNLNMSMFERLVEAGAVQHVTLQQQRRMRPEIADLIRGSLYPELEDHPAVLEYPHVKGMVKDLFFWDHDIKEGGTDQSKSRYNTHEVDACVALARYLLQQGYCGEGQPDICILTPYVGQLLKLRQAVAAVADLKFVMSDRDAADLADAMSNAQTTDIVMSDSDESDADNNSSSGGLAGAGDASNALLAGAGNKVVTFGQSLRLATIDNFQGEEAKVFILSLVRNPKEQKAGIGFLAVNNRINVLLSRAKEGMYLVGSSAALYAASEKAAAAGRPCMWSSVLDKLGSTAALGPNLQVCCQRHGKVTDINAPREFQSLVGDGGCQQECGMRLPCGHTCPRRCHADDPCHTQTKCLKPCGKLCARGRHACRRLCWEPCTRCNTLEEDVQLPCGHTAHRIECHRAAEPETIPCTELVSVSIPGCGHKLTVPCSKRAALLDGTALCTQMVHVTLPGCGHTLILPCGKAAQALLEPSMCSAICGGLLPGCEHTCSSTCGKCMQVRADPPDNASQHPATDVGDGAARTCGMHELFLLDLHVNKPELHKLWTDWCEDHKGGNAASLRSEHVARRWQRFVKDKLATALGSSQCAELNGIAAMSDNSTNLSPGSSSVGSSGSGSIKWRRYLQGARLQSGQSSAWERLAVEWQSWLVSIADTAAAAVAPDAGSATRSFMDRIKSTHDRCKTLCEKPLACGHSCKATCHHGSPCSPCRQVCTISCEHASCSQKCAAPCAPCAEPCGWFCEHKGSCLLPCGVPCDREPCNMRCSKMLPCGHRCPGLCGEACLPQKFCVHPKCKAKAPEEVQDRVVEMLLFTTFKDLSYADVTADPLIVLPCGHLFTTSTLDGLMAMSEAYAPVTPAGSSSNEEALTEWGAPLSRDDFPPPKTCPDCRRIIGRVRRYGRVVMHYQLGVMQRKYAEDIRLRLRQGLGGLGKLQDQLLSASAAWRDISAKSVGSLIDKRKPLGPALLSQLREGGDRAWNLALGFHRLASQAHQTVKTVVAERHQAALRKAIEDGKLETAVGEERWAAAQAFGGKPDLQLAFEAMQGYAGAVQFSLKLVMHRLEVLGTALDTVSVTIDRLQRSQEQRTDTGPPRGLERWLREQMRLLEGQAHQLTARAHNLFTDATQNIRWAIGASAGDACYTASYQLSHCLMTLLLERASQLTPLKQTAFAQLLAATPAATSGQTSYEAYQQRIRGMQQQALEQAEGAGRAALQTFDAQKQMLMAAAGDDPSERERVQHIENADVEKVMALLKKLPSIKAELEGELGAAEIAAVLGALMKAEGRHYSELGLQSFMAGHLYECPNGHIFVIGECGRAMQEGHCDRCGARIGGTSHRLNASNRQAGSALRAAVMRASAAP